MKILVLIMVVQSLNLVIFVWFNRVAGLRILVLRQQLTLYKHKSKKPVLRNRDRLFWSVLSRIRKVIDLHVTDHPALEWAKQQIRNACFEEEPKFLLHDSDGKFGQLAHPFRVEGAGKRGWCRSAYDAWLWQEMGIRGVPIPYDAPNAAAHIERLIGTLRRECLDRMLIWNERHLRCVLK